VTLNQPQRQLAFRSVIPVWMLMVVGAILVGVFAPAAHYLDWLPIVMAAGILVTFSVQLAAVQKEGLVNRVMASLGGSLVILAIASAILSLIALAR
jgi:hypothetical protein